jgi:surface protein
MHSSKAAFLACWIWAMIFRAGDYVNVQKDIPPKICFPDRATLHAAIDDAITYTADGTGDGYNHLIYGPIKSWCFDASLTDFSDLFFDLFPLSVSFNADISGWNVSKVTNMSGMASLDCVCCLL